MSFIAQASLIVESVYRVAKTRQWRVIRLSGVRVAFSPLPVSFLRWLVKELKRFCCCHRVCSRRKKLLCLEDVMKFDLSPFLIKSCRLFARPPCDRFREHPRKEEVVSNSKVAFKLRSSSIRELVTREIEKQMVLPIH